jgi:MFS family permease
MSLAYLLNVRLIALPLQNPNFGIYSAGNAVSLIGMWMQRIAVGWLAWQLTHSGFWLGIVSFADFFPVVLVGPIAGAFADRWDRLTVVKVSQTISLLQAMVLFLLTITDNVNIGILVGLTAFQGVVVAFNQPARLALVPSLVPPADLGSAVAINSVVFNLARFIGPIFAGFAIVGSGLSAAFAANACTYAVFLLALARIRIDPSETLEARPPSSFIADLVEGIRYTATHPGIAALLLLLVAFGIGGRPFNELLPGIAANVYHSGAGGLSVLASAVGAGAIIGGLWLGQRSTTSGLTWIALGTALMAAVSAMAAVATTNLWLAVPAVVLFGFGMSAAGIATQTLIQIATERSMRGRVMGLYGLIYRGSPSLGALWAGIASSNFGFRGPVVLGALLVIAVWAWVFTGRERMIASLETRETSGV